VLRGIGSRELAVRAARREFGGDGRPTVISPASSMQVEAARTDGAALHPGAPSFITEKSGSGDAAGGGDLAGTRPVALAPGLENFWQNLHAALTDSATAPVRL